jgi:hypothetical protein
MRKDRRKGKSKTSNARLERKLVRKNLKRKEKDISTETRTTNSLTSVKV